MSLTNPVENAPRAFHASGLMVGYLAATIRDSSATFELERHMETARVTRLQLTNRKYLDGDAARIEICARLPPAQGRIVGRQHTALPYLMIMPSVDCGTTLSPDEFRTGTNLRYGWIPRNLSKVCDGCGAKFDMNHALSCNHGGLMITSHDQLSHTLQDLGKAALGPSKVRDEPRTKLGRGAALKGSPTEVQDVQVNHQRRGDGLYIGFWSAYTDTILDCQFVNLEAESYKDREPDAVLASRQAAKKKKHRGDCELNRRHFTPFISSRDAILAKEANSFTRALAAHLAKKWNRAYSDTCGYIKGRLGLTIIRATTRCLYGSRVPARHVSTAPIWSDGLGLGLWTTMSDPPFSGIPPSAVRRAEA